MRDPETGRFVKAAPKPEEKPKVSLADKAKARRERLGRKRGDGMAPRDPSLQPPRGGILDEIKKRGRKDQIR